MYYATSEAGSRARPRPGASGTCPSCSGAVRAKCGQVNVWHWAHRAGGECDLWSEAMTDWHWGYQSIVPADRCEVVMGTHRADVVTPDGYVVELQHSSVSIDDIRAREAHYGPKMYWLFDAREARAMGRISLCLRAHGYVEFRWSYGRRSIKACRAHILLDLGEGLTLRVKEIGSDGGISGIGHVFETVAIWRWMRDGVPPKPIMGTGASHQDLVDRIVRTTAFLDCGEVATSPQEAAAAKGLVARAALFPGLEPNPALSAAIVAAGPNTQGMLGVSSLKGRWVSDGNGRPVVSVECCSACGEPHTFHAGPSNYSSIWNNWVRTNEWPQVLDRTCVAGPGKSPATVPVDVPKPPLVAYGRAVATAHE